MVWSLSSVLALCFYGVMRSKRGSCAVRRATTRPELRNRFKNRSEPRNRFKNRQKSRNRRLRIPLFKGLWDLLKNPEIFLHKVANLLVQTVIQKPVQQPTRKPPYVTFKRFQSSLYFVVLNFQSFVCGFSLFRYILRF